MSNQSSTISNEVQVFTSDASKLIKVEWFLKFYSSIYIFFNIMSMCIYLNFKRGKKIACKIKKKHSES